MLFYLSEVLIVFEFEVVNRDRKSPSAGGVWYCRQKVDVGQLVVSPLPETQKTEQQHV